MFKEFELSEREKSTYDRIQSELDEMFELIISKSVKLGLITDFMEKYKQAIEARENLIHTIATSRCVLVTSIVSIFDGKAIYR